MLEIKVRQGTKVPKGQVNEDAKLVDRRRNIFLVADGIGGHPVPERASQLAVMSCYQELVRILPYAEENGVLPYIHRAMGYSNQVLSALSDRLVQFRSDEKRAGTTLDVCYIQNNKLYAGHIGDGRIYLLRHSELSKLTEDHTLLESGLEEGAAKFRERVGLGGVSRYIGDAGDFNPQLLSVPLRADDLVLMTTDGLTKMLFDKEIAEVLQQAPFEKSARKLLTASNIPVMLASYISTMKNISYEEALRKLPNDDSIAVVLISVKEGYHG